MAASSQGPQLLGTEGLRAFHEELCWLDSSSSVWSWGLKSQGMTSFLGGGNMVLLLAQADKGFYFITQISPGPSVDTFF